MKTIYVNKELFKEAVDYINNEMTFYAFISNVKMFLKELLSSPSTADITDFLKEHGVDRKTLLNKLLDKGIVEKETKIENKDNKDSFLISYKIPKRNFERKMKRLFMSMYEQMNGNIITEDGEGGGPGCAGVMGGGGSNPDAGTYVKPLGQVQRRKIYITNEQSEILKEMSTQDVGNYQYDVPFKFNNGNDPAYNHKNMIKQGIPKKKGARKKSKNYDLQ